ncbi:MAG: DUF1302 domain-containing protein [Deferrisomatales bacterium]|nr:DUF1302 domain-containing protein [Deferrisomatales bacterium]
MVDEQVLRLQCRYPFWLRGPIRLVATALVSVLSIPAAHAFQFDLGDSDIRLRWDNTVKYSVAMRTESRSGVLTDPDRNPSNTNQDDGDQNFDKGLISNRVDLYSEADLIYKGFGLRASGAAWYDTVYNSTNDNDSPFTANARSVDHDEFTDDTRDLHGRKAELLDAFAFGKVNMGPTTTSFRVGQYAMQWGESLFFGNNGIAGGMAPIDVVKLLSVPNSQFKEIIRPVPQTSAQVQIGPSVAIGGYYQFGWEKTVLPAVGSYFSSADILDEGAEQLIVASVPGVGPVAGLYKGDDQDAKDSGQGGVQLRVRPGFGLDLGFYAIQYHDKTPQIYVMPGVDPNIGVINPGVLDPSDPSKAGEYFLTYPENIRAYGMSATTTWDVWNFAAEVSMRRNTPLVSDPVTIIPAFDLNAGADNDDNPGYAVGRSVHAQFNWFAVFGPSFISNEASFLGEVAWNRVTSITKNSDVVDPNAERTGLGFRMVYEPTYRQVMSGLDLSVPVGLAYFPKGRSMVVSNFGPDNGGDMSLGLNATYLDVWRFALNYTHFYGPAEGALDSETHLSLKQSLADRDFVAFSVRRTF